jgi:hypothetical protein
MMRRGREKDKDKNGMDDEDVFVNFFCHTVDSVVYYTTYFTILFFIFRGAFTGREELVARKMPNKSALFFSH